MSQIPLVDLITQYFSPVILAVTEPKTYLFPLIEDLDFKIDLNPDQADLVNTILNIQSSVNAIEILLKSLQPPEPVPDAPPPTEAEMEAANNALGLKIAQAIEKIVPLAQAVKADIERLKSKNLEELETLPAPLKDPEWWNNLGKEIPAYLLMKWLQLHKPIIYELFYFSGAIEETLLPSTRIKSKIQWSEVSTLFKDPLECLKHHYDWDGDFKHQLLIKNLQRLIDAFSLETRTQEVSEEEKENLNLTELTNQLSRMEFRFTPQFPGAGVEAIFRMMPILGQGQDRFGLQLEGELIGNLQSKFALNPNWTFDVTELASDLKARIQLQIKPSTGISIINTETPQIDGRLRLIGDFSKKPWIIFGQKDSARFEIKHLEAALHLKKLPDGQYEIILGAESFGSDEPGFNLVINPANGDSFISEILGKQKLEMPIDFGLAWSSKSGLTVKGGGGFGITIPINKTLGPINLTHGRLEFGASTNGLRLQTSISGGIKAGVFSFTVDNVGVSGQVMPLPEGDNSGLLGPIDLKYGFKTPDGIGLAIKGGDILGGGAYLNHNEQKSQYSGIGQISFTKLNLTAVGILATKMPDGSSGWSLFLSVFAEFSAMQIGFGFTLNGVGGLIGLHRTLDDTAIRQRLLTGSLDSIMFPIDPIKNAPKILADIEAVFPIAKNQVVFGIMLKLGWGTPTLITADIGIIVQLPDPIRVALLGRIHAVLPNTTTPVIKLNMDVFGLADFSAKTIAIDAVLRDSNIMEILTLQGEMAFRANFLNSPSMIMALGGFHPKFKAPANFPKLRLLTASLPIGDYARLSLSAYIALTPNTFQFGARIDVWAKIMGFSITGYFQMDTLIEFKPFSFDVYVGFGVAIKAGSVAIAIVEVRANVHGPSQWRVNGEATFEILFLKKTIPISIESGTEKINHLAKQNLQNLLMDALNKDENWTAEEKSGKAVLLRKREKSEPPAILPTGLLSVKQNVVPLQRTLQIYAGAEIEGKNSFEIESIKIDGTVVDLAPSSYQKEWFASAQYFKMSESEKIQAPAFEQYTGGIAFSSDKATLGSQHFDIDIKYEESFIDDTLNLNGKSNSPANPLTDEQLLTLKPSAIKVKRAPQYTVNESEYSLLDGTKGLSIDLIKTSSYCEAITKLNELKKNNQRIKHIEVVSNEELKAMRN